MDVRRVRNMFQFNESDLVANRRGQFSAKQQERLETEARQVQKSARESAAILFVIAAAGLLIGITIGYLAPALLGRLAMLFFMGILWPAAWVGRAISILREARLLQTPVLRAVTGPVRILDHGAGEYTLQVGDLEFDVDGNPTGAFADSEQCTFYYVMATEEVLSVE